MDAVWPMRIRKVATRQIMSVEKSTKAGSYADLTFRTGRATATATQRVVICTASAVGDGLEYVIALEQIKHQAASR